MKVYELMLGNIIQYEYEGERFTARVKEIYNDSVLVDEVSGWYEEIEIPMRDIYPIPLTPEILEKNGFLYSDLPFEQSWQQYGLSIYGTTGNYHINCGINVSMDVSNVHQLQHALRLCGIEKEIEL